MSSMLRVGSALLDVDLFVDQQLMVVDQINKEWDRNVPVQAQLDYEDEAWYNTYREAA